MKEIPLSLQTKIETFFKEWTIDKIHNIFVDEQFFAIGY